MIAVQSNMLYGCNTMHITNSVISLLKRTHGKHIKTVMGLRYHAHSKPLLLVTGFVSIATSLQYSSLELLKSCLCSSSAAEKFYRHKFYCDPKLNTKTRPTCIIPKFVIMQ